MLRVTGDIGDRQHLNTAVSALMELTNGLYRFSDEHPDDTRSLTAAVRALVLMLAPIAPFMAEELWQRIDGRGSVHLASWPALEECLIEDDEMTIAVQVDGRLRDRITVPAGAGAAEIEQVALGRDRVARALNGRRLIDVVYVPARLINLILEQSGTSGRAR